MNEGRRLVANSDTQSYAAELEVLSKDEVKKRVFWEIFRNPFPIVCRISIFTDVNLFYSFSFLGLIFFSPIKFCS